jgi:predicted ArsR family transcriptional regulator
MQGVGRGATVGSEGGERGELDRRLASVAALGEPVRRSLYQYVANQPDPVSREQAATATGVAVHVAKFHLERLVDDGLLEFDYRRPAGRGGPGAGRPAKVYRAAGEIDVTLPERRYDLAGRLLVRGIDAAVRSGDSVSDAIEEVARAEGRDIALEVTGSRRGKLQRVLVDCGFHPSSTGPEIVLRNCPFHRLAEENRELVCSMNLAFVSGLLDGLEVDDVTAHLVPTPGECCVRLRR